MNNQTTTTNDFAPFGTFFCVRLEMLSDWHIGSGTGRPGEVDRLVLRDDNGLPYVPAKTLTGIWRDACERAAFGLDNGKPGAWCRWVPFLFGEQAAHRSQELEAILPEDFEHPRPAALSVRAAHLPPDLIHALASEDKHAVREAVTFLKPGVSLDARSGRAKEKHLRFEEMARLGASLTAQCEIAWGNECSDLQRRTATALLLAGAQLVERLGGKRRRGAGHCVLTILDSPELEKVWQWVESLSAEQVPTPPKPKVAEPFNWDKPETQSNWTRVRLTLTTTTPVVVSTRTVGNFVETADYIPGTYLLAIVRRTLQPLGINLNTAIVNGDLLVTNATCEVGNERGRPTPLSLMHEKLSEGLNDGKDVFNRFCEPDQGKRLKSQHGGYVGATVKDVIPNYRNVTRGIRMHNVVQDELQRPHEDVGGVFSYQAISAGQTLGAELRLRTTLAQKLAGKNADWFAALSGTHRLGRSKKDDYGVIRLVAALESEPPAPEAKPTELTVWLLSDLLLRDERLRPTASVQALKKALETELEKLTSSGVKLLVRETGNSKLLSNLIRPHRIDSWQVSWELPRPSLAGLAAGSCVVFTVEKGEVSEKALDQLAKQGLGERRAEGFGQLSFNDPLLEATLSDKERLDSVPPRKKKQLFLIPKQSAFDYARVIERDAVRREIQRQALAFASNPDNRKTALGIEINLNTRKSHPPMSQLGALRSILSRLEIDKQSVLAWLAHLEDTPNRFEKWKHGLQALRDLLDEPVRTNKAKQVWELLPFDWSNLVITETGEDELKDELWAEAVRALVDACVRAQKRQLESELKKGDQDNGA